MSINLKIVFLLIILFLIPGCSNNNEGEASYLEVAREEVNNQNYGEAESQLKKHLKNDSNNSEARALLNYIDYKDNMLLAAFWENDVDAVQYIAPVIHDINHLDPRFEASVLVLAAAWEQNDMVKILLEAGADPNQGADKDGLTALLWACKNFNDRADVVKALLEAGADMAAESIYGETAYEIAETYGNTGILKLLSEYE